MNKFNLLFSALSFSVLSVAAQDSVIAPTNTEYLGGSTRSTFQNTGIAIPSNAELMASVWEFDGSTIFDWYDLNGTLPWAQQKIVGAKDPDIEFPGDGNADGLFIGYHTDQAVHINYYYLTTPAGYVLANSQTIATGNNIHSVNIDIDNGEGVIVWEDGMDVYATTFNNTNHGFPTYIDNGVHPDVVVHPFDYTDQSEHYTICYSDFNNDLQIVRGLTQEVKIGITNYYATYTEQAAGSTIMLYPRIASPRSNAYGFDREDFTVTALRRDLGTSPNEYMIVGASVTNGNYTHYEVTPNAGTSVNLNPVVAYNSDRVKFAWASDYEAPLSSGWNSPSIKRDVLSKEYDPVSMTFFYPNSIFEINNQQGLGFENCKPSITGRDTNWGDKNAYLYNMSGQLVNSIYRKYLDNTSNPKRTAKPVNNEIILSKLNNLFLLNGEDLTKYEFSLTNMNGQLIDISSRIELSNLELTLNPNGLSKGMYFLNCQSKEHTQTVKILVD